MLMKSDILIMYWLDEDCKILFENVKVVKVIEQTNEAIVQDEDGKEYEVDLDLVNDEVQTDGRFYMSDEVFLKAYAIFEREIQFEKVCAENVLKTTSEKQENFYKRNGSEKESVIRVIRNKNEELGDDGPIIPIGL